MPMLGGGTDAMPTHRRGGGESACSPTLTDADTITDGYTTDRDSNENRMLKLEIELSLANRRIDKLTQQKDDLARQNKRLTASESGLGDRVADLKKELIEQYNRASEAVKRADTADTAGIVTSSRELRAVQMRLVAAETERDTALEARGEAVKTAEQAKFDAQLQSSRFQSAQTDNQRLAAELSAARSANLDIHRNEVTNMTASVAERDAKIRRLESDATKYKTKIDQLGDSCSLLRLENARISDDLEKTKKTLKTNQDAVVFLEGRKENLEADNGELRERMARSATDFATVSHSCTPHQHLYAKAILIFFSLQVVHNSMLDQRNRTTPAQFPSTAQDTRLTTENARLKDDCQFYVSNINALRSNMAYNITQFDLAWDGWRLFNCQHANLRDIPDVNHSTRERPLWTDVVMSLLEDWMDDDQFIKEYNNERRYVLQHHRAHERVPQGKAVASFRIKNEFVKADQKRGIPIKY